MVADAIDGMQKVQNEKFGKTAVYAYPVEADNNVILRCVNVAAPSPQEISTHSART